VPGLGLCRLYGDHTRIKVDYNKDGKVDWVESSGCKIAGRAHRGTIGTG
jgi:hypothetical protein